MAVIEAIDLRRTYQTTTGVIRRKRLNVEAVRGISFSVEQGELFGLLGPNGAGKTTTIKMLITLLLPTSGEARVLGYDVIEHAREVRKRIGYVFGGDRGLYERLSAYDNLRYFAELYGVSGHRQKQRIDEVLELVGLKGREKERVEGYSRGMRQRLHIARGILHDPEVVFLDEPTIGVDRVGARDLRQMIADLITLGKTVLLTTHYMFEADALCDRISGDCQSTMRSPHEMTAPAETRMFAGGECRQLWARDSTLPPDAPLVRIGLGESEALRAACKNGRLICPFPGCESPAYNTAGGPQRRDHFRHVHRSAQLDHHPDVFFHVVGKSLVADWLRKQGATVSVRVESRLPNDQRPDVLAVFPDGRRFAFEVQYAALTADAWQRRHDGYATQGIVDYWLFGHLPTHLRRAYGAAPAHAVYRLHEVQRLLERHVRRVYWLDPDELALGTRLIETGKTLRRDVAQVGWDELSDCRIEGSNLASPTELRERESAAELERLGRPSRWRSMIEAEEREEQARRDQQRREEEYARQAELRRRAPAREIDLPVVRARPRHPRPTPAEPRIAVPKVPPYHDQSGVREAIEAALTPHVGKTMRTPEVLAFLAEHGIAVSDFINQAWNLERDGFIYFGAFSLTGGRVKITGR